MAGIVCLLSVASCQALNAQIHNQPQNLTMSPEVATTLGVVTSMAKYTEFLYACNDKIPGDKSADIVKCDSSLQKLGIEIGKWFVANKYLIESVIYPTTIPYSAEEYSKKSITDVVGQSNNTQYLAHLLSVYPYAKYIRAFSMGCKYNLHAYNLDNTRTQNLEVYSKCFDAFRNLNEHFHTLFNATESETKSIMGVGWDGVVAPLPIK